MKTIAAYIIIGLWSTTNLKSYARDFLATDSLVKKVVKTAMSSDDYFIETSTGGAHKNSASRQQAMKDSASFQEALDDSIFVMKGQHPNPNVKMRSTRYTKRKHRHIFFVPAVAKRDELPVNFYKYEGIALLNIFDDRTGLLIGQIWQRPYKFVKESITGRYRYIPPKEWKVIYPPNSTVAAVLQ